MNFSNIENFPFLYDLNTRWKDMDSFGHVNNAVFLTYLEDARISLCKHWDLDGKKKSIIMASIKIDYLRQLGHPSALIIGQKVARIGNTSFDIHSVIFIKNDSNPVTSAVITCVCFDYEQNKKVSVYPKIKSDFCQSQTA